MSFYNTFYFYSLKGADHIWVHHVHKSFLSSCSLFVDRFSVQKRLFCARPSEVLEQ